MISNGGDGVFDVLDCGVRTLLQVLTHRVVIPDKVGTPHSLFRAVDVVLEQNEFVAPSIVAAREHAPDPIDRIHRHLLTVDVHWRLSRCVELIPQRFHASAKIHGPAEITAWGGVCTLDLVLDFVEEDSNELGFEDMFGTVEVRATLTCRL